VAFGRQLLENLRKSLESGRNLCQIARNIVIGIFMYCRDFIWLKRNLVSPCSCVISSMSTAIKAMDVKRIDLQLKQNDSE